MSLRRKKLITKGYYGIGVECMKHSVNYGTLFRTALILDANFVFLIGKRFKKQASDVLNTWKHIPLFEYDNIKQFNNNRPYDCPLIGIEMEENSTFIEDFYHPRNAMYLLGSEDNGLSNSALKICNTLVRLQGDKSLNVAVAGSIVLYDRISKLNKQ